VPATAISSKPTKEDDRGFLSAPAINQEAIEIGVRAPPATQMLERQQPTPATRFENPETKEFPFARCFHGEDDRIRS
jgi:hypothetical protein